MPLLRSYFKLVTIKWVTMSQDVFFVAVVFTLSAWSSIWRLLNDRINISSLCASLNIMYYVCTKQNRNADTGSVDLLNTVYKRGSEHNENIDWISVLSINVLNTKQCHEKHYTCFVVVFVLLFLLNILLMLVDTFF